MKILEKIVVVAVQEHMDKLHVFDHCFATTIPLCGMTTRTMTPLTRGGLVVAPKVHVVAKQWSSTLHVHTLPCLQIRYFCSILMVSIIISYIDEHDYLAEALASAVGQREVDAEIIVVCNARTVSEGYDPIPGGYKNIKFIHEPITGSAYARNAGLQHAKGEWVQYLDVDDLLHPDKIHHQMNIRDADVVVSPHTFLFVNGKEENSKWLPEDFWCGLLNSGLGSTSSMLWKRQALLDVEGWSTAYQSHQEYELLFRLAAAGKKIARNDHCETIVRQRKSGSITSTTKSLRAKEGIRLRETIWNHLIGHQMNTPERFEAFRQYIFRQLRGLYRQDKYEANGLFEKYFSEEPFTPKDIHAPGYNILYTLFGFQRTESLIQFLISFRKSNLKADNIEK